MSEQAMGRRRRRWSDNDRHLGPFTFAYTRCYRTIGIVLDSGKTSGCHVRVSAFGLTLICEMPAIIKPQRTWHSTPGGGYWDEYEREYGFSYGDGFLQVKHGAQTHSSDTDHNWGCFLPWTQSRVISHKVFEADNEDYVEINGMGWDERSAIMDSTRKQRFAITDYDGERIEVETYVDEMTWRRGTGWFRWIGYLMPTKTRRSLDLKFNKEVGPEKGSWKGGTVGHSTEIARGETAEQALRRYCERDHSSKHRRFQVAFVGRL